MARTLAGLALCAGLLAAVAGCDSNPFDPAQVPAVTVRPGTPPEIAWTPAGAQIVRVFRGATAGDGSYSADLVWDVAAAAPGNTIASPLRYGVAPAGTQASAPEVLVAGQPYTVWVFRDDPAGSGDGFTNTRNRYVGTATFVP